MIKINSAVLFSVNGFHGNGNLAYLCLQLGAAELYHFGLIPVPAPNPPLRLIGCVLPTHMQSTFYPTPKNLSQFDPPTPENREMLSVAVQIKTLPEQLVKVWLNTYCNSEFCM